MNSESVRILVERIYHVINQEMCRIETTGPKIIKSLIEEKENKYIAKLANNDKAKETQIKEILHKTRNLQVKISNDIGHIKELRGPGMVADEASTLTELKDTERIEEEWKMKEYDVIHGRRMNDEPWCICSMTIIKKRLSELIVNANNLTKAADMHMNDIMCFSDKETKEKYRQIINLLSMTWEDFKDGPFLPEEDIIWSPETICRYTLQRKFEFVLWLIVSNTLNIRMRMKMYNDVLGEIKRQVKTEETEDAERKSGIHVTHHATGNTLSTEVKCKDGKDKVFRKRHAKLIEASAGGRVKGIKRNKIMCKTDSIIKVNEEEEECNNRVIYKKNPARKQKDEAMKKMTSIKDSLKAYSYIF